MFWGWSSGSFRGAMKQWTWVYKKKNKTGVIFNGAADFGVDIVIKDNVCIALFFMRNELAALYTFTQQLMKMMYTCIVQSLHAIVACLVRSVG